MERIAMNILLVPEREPAFLCGLCPADVEHRAIWRGFSLRTRKEHGVAAQGGWRGAALKDGSSMAWQQAAPAKVCRRGSSIGCTNQKRWAKGRAGSFAGAACCQDFRPYTHRGE